ncbi:MAG: hypothetical protein AAGI69_17305 [Cyanobacteria bacterium P01_H01_bin.21]
MNDLDMELQTIRQKLQTLKASPPETVAAPWNPSRLTAPSPNLAQVTTAIETLRQRSGQTLSPPVTSSSLQQFDAALRAVEQLAQQQQQALKRLQSLGAGLVQQIQPGTSPDVDDIARFLADCQTVEVPTVHRDTNGYLGLGYHLVDFQQAEHDATSNADALRVRSQLFKHSLTQETQMSRSGKVPYIHKGADGILGNVKHLGRLAYRSIEKWLRPYIHANQHSRSSTFTLADGAIWCVGAAVARLTLKQIFQIYPALWPPVAFVVIAGIVLSLYQAIFSPRPNPALGYRTLMIILGLLLGGRFA